MFEILKGNQHLLRIIVFMLIASIGILTLSILSDTDDGRRQIIDKDGSSEEQLCILLSSVKGAGECDVMVEYRDDNSISGVMVISEGGSDPVVANNLTKGVATLYNIPLSSVIVFEKEQGEWPWKNLNLAIKISFTKAKD